MHWVVSIVCGSDACISSSHPNAGAYPCLNCGLMPGQPVHLLLAGGFGGREGHPVTGGRRDGMPARSYVDALNECWTPSTNGSRIG